MTISKFAEGNSVDSSSTVDDCGVSPMNPLVDDGANDDSIDGQNSDDSYQLVESTEDKSAKENSPSATRDTWAKDQLPPELVEKAKGILKNSVAIKMAHENRSRMAAEIRSRRAEGRSVKHIGHRIQYNREGEEVGRRRLLLDETTDKEYVETSTELSEKEEVGRQRLLLDGTTDKEYVETSTELSGWQRPVKIPLPLWSVVFMGMSFLAVFVAMIFALSVASMLLLGGASNGQGGGMVNIFGHMQVERSIPNHPPPNDIRIDSKYLTFNVDSSSLPHNLLDAISSEVQRQTTQRVDEMRNEEKKTKKRMKKDKQKGHQHVHKETWEGKEQRDDMQQQNNRGKKKETEKKATSQI